MSEPKTPPPYIVLPQTNEPLQRILWRCGYKSSWDEIREQVYRFNVESSLEFQISKAKVDAYRAHIDTCVAIMQADVHRFQCMADAYNAKVLGQFWVKTK